MNWAIAIPTRGRTSPVPIPGKKSYTKPQQTLKGIPPSMLHNTVVFCPEGEVDKLTRFAENNLKAIPIIEAQPDPNMTIAAKRLWIMEHLEERGVEKVIMLDDDLFFYKRYMAEKGWRLLDAEPHDVEFWFNQILEKLSPEVPHAGFGARQGNDKHESGWLEGTRMMLALAYHIPTVLREAVWNRIQTREDMDISLQLLRKGLPNLVTHEFAVGQEDYGMPGGCTGQRTTESSDADAFKLAEFHPGFVRVVDKEYKGHPRKEVVCSWKKALAAGRAGA